MITASVDEVLQWSRDGSITDGKTLVAALWLQNLVSGAWSLEWKAAAAGAPAG